MARTLDFAVAKAAVTKEMPEFAMAVQPALMGLDIAKVGKEPVDLIYRGFTTDEYTAILEDIKDEEGRNWVIERNMAIIQLCLVTPAIPTTAEGRRFLDGWAPGLVVNVADQIEAASGYRRDYVVKDAKDALKNSGNPIPKDTSSSK